MPTSDDTRTREHATAATASRLGYRPELDGVRGVAILLVILVHVHHWPRGGFIGVDVFFALSGFLITTLLLEEWQARGKISLRNFYARRALRLFPAVIVLLVVYLIFALLAGGSNLSTRLAGVGYGFTYVSNWQAYGLAFPQQEIGFLWTLAIEEQFYLLWPGLLLLAVHFGRLSARRLIVATLCVVAAVWTWRIVIVEAGVDGPRVYFGTDTRLDQLLLGAALAAWFVRRPSSAAGSLVLRLAGWAGVIFLTWRLFDSVYFRWWYPTIGLAAIGLASTAIIACVVTDSSAVLKWTLNMRWLRWVGALSYSLYLWHVPAIRLVEGSPLGQFTVLRILGGISLSFALAVVSYRYVEQPFLRRRKKPERLSATKADAEADLGAIQPPRHPAVPGGRASSRKAPEP